MLMQVLSKVLLQSSKHFANIFVTVHESFLSSCRCREIARFFPAVTIQVDRDLQQCVEFHFSLTGRNLNRNNVCIILGVSELQRLRSPELGRQMRERH
jgi:hypothetical protein